MKNLIKEISADEFATNLVCFCSAFITVLFLVGVFEYFSK
jgi:hypothetical protein